MGHSVRLLSLLLLAGTAWGGCAGSGQPPAPDWYLSPPPCMNAYCGLGEGATHADAKRMALGALCESIKTTVTSEFVSEETHRVRERMRKNLAQTDVDYDQAVQLIVATSSRCTFEGVPYREQPRPAQIGDRAFVRLVLPADDYARFLASHRTGLRVVGSGAKLPAETQAALFVAAERCLTAQGYLPARAADQKMPYVLEITFEPTLADAGVEGLKSATAAPAMRLVERRSGRIVWQVSLSRVKAVGFDGETVLERLGGEMVSRVTEECSSLP